MLPRNVWSISAVYPSSGLYHDYPAFGDYSVKIYGEIYWYCAMGIGGDTPVRWSQFPRVKTLNFTDSLTLDRLQCAYGSLVELNLAKLPNISQLLVDGNKLTTLDLSALSKLSLFYCQNNLLDSLDVNRNALLLNLDCSRNRIQLLDLRQTGLIEKLNCSYNKMTSLLIGTNNLKEVDCSGNLLSTETLNEIFKNLPTNSTGKINIKWNTGADLCDRSIATNKGWQVVEI